MNEIKLTLYSDLVLLNIKEGISPENSELQISKDLYTNLIENNEKLGYTKDGIITNLGTRHLRSKYMNLI